MRIPWQAQANCMRRPFPGQAGGPAHRRRTLGPWDGPFSDRQGEAVENPIASASRIQIYKCRATARSSPQRGCGIPRACQAKGFQSAPQRCNRRFQGRQFSRLRGLKRDCSRAQPSATSRRRADALVILSSSRLEISSKYAKRRVLRCFGPIFQKGHFDKSGFRSALSRAAGRKGAL